MPFTAQELSNMADAALDFYIKGQATDSGIQEKPTLAALRAAQKTFPGGKGSIRRNVKGVHSTAFSGYTHDDTVTYGNPTNLRQTDYPWRELHAGISVTETELKVDGISVVDDTGGDTVTHDGREMTAITGLLEDKMQDMDEGSLASMNRIIWLDGSQDAKVFPGIQSIILPSATVATGTTGGIDRATNPWWRNRALTGGDKITASNTSQTLTRKLREEVRQLKRFGGRPSHVACGSKFLERLEWEVQEKGSYTDQGFANNGKTEIGMADISMRGVGRFMYDPVLDDLGLEYFSYFIDPRHLGLYVMDGEDMKPRRPTRPAEKYVLYRGVTWTGGMVADQLNCHGVYEVAA